MPWDIFKSVVIVIVCCLFCHLPVAQADSWEISIQNDILLGTDEHFTNGIGFGWYQDVGAGTDFNNINIHELSWIHRLIYNLSPFDLKRNSLIAGLKIEQDIFTPEDTTTSELILDDIPYAGHLLSSFSLIEADIDYFKEIYLQVGIVGPSSGGEFVQKTAHWLFNNAQPNGWHNQLPDQMTLGIGLSHEWRTWQRTLSSGLIVDLDHLYGVDIGNFATSLRFGSIIRLKTSQFNKRFQRYQSRNSGVVFDPGIKMYGWSIYASYQLNVLAYSMLLDSREQLSENRSLLNGVFSVGGTVVFPFFEVSFALYTTSFSSSLYQNSRSSWGGINFNVS